MRASPSLTSELLCVALAAASTAFAADSSTATAAATCSVPSSNVPAPSTAPGYTARLVATGLSDPRGIMFDANGHLLVIQRDQGLISLTLDETDDCITVSEKKFLVNNTGMTHGLELSRDGKTLYASTTADLFSWNYDPETQKLSGRRKLVTGMETDDHTTRTLLLSRKTKKPYMVISRGSTSNVDALAAVKSSGHSQVRAWDVKSIDQPVDYSSSGRLMGWGLRNSVGVAEHPVTGGIWTVENSVDTMHRQGKDIHQNNPGEEMNFVGYLNGTKTPEQGGNFGYPYCFAAWGVKAIPDNEAIDVGTQFAIGTPNATKNDDICQNERIAPRLTFTAHMAPLDIKFNEKGTVAFVTFHGSWDRDVPAGYKLSTIAFTESGEPVEPSNSKTAAVDVVSNQDSSICATTAKCFRPVGLAWDSKGRLWMSSDATGEIYVIDVPTEDMVPKSPSSTNPVSPSKPTGGNGDNDSGASSRWLGRSEAALMVVLLAFCVFM